jgi:hypothetical protein
LKKTGDACVFLISTKVFFNVQQTVIFFQATASDKQHGEKRVNVVLGVPKLYTQDK